MKKTLTLILLIVTLSTFAQTKRFSLDGALELGIPIGDFSDIADAGFGNCFGHGLGHGVGLAVHEPPSLNRIRRNKLRPGMVVTVEPGIYLPGWGGVRLENMVVVEEGGCTVLNQDTTFLDL